MCQAVGLGGNVSVELGGCSATVFKSVVLVVELDEPFSQRKPMAEALMGLKGQFPRRQLACQQVVGESSHGSLFTVRAPGSVVGEAKFFEGRWEDLGNVVVSFASCA
ncbi:hypothetical protein HY68_35530 [Streptomyces sp. AcH 505]|nr:hypothetical protein HY68_35530 [Streptomyces sp. AcH 505]